MCLEKKYLEKPWIINVELTNACNLECIFCDHPIFKKNMKIKEMDDQLLIRVLTDVKEKRIYELGLVGLGEPTLDRNLKRHLEIINNYADNFERISFNSNLVSLKKEQAEILSESRVNAYTFSVNASNRNFYLNLTGKDKFNHIIENLKTFINILNAKKRKPRVDIQIFESGQNNLQEIKALFPEADDLGVNFFYRKVYNKPVIQDKKINLVNAHTPNEKLRYPCWDMYTRIYIDVEGNLYPCTIGNDSYRETSQLCLGNVYYNSVLDLFNCEKIQMARRISEKGEIPFIECKLCNIWFLTPNNFEWDETNLKWKKKEKQIRAYSLKE